MNPSDKRLNELLDKWLTSLELHLKYTGLEDERYRKVQPWPAHDRPSRWIVELALQKVKLLKEQHASRVAMGDIKFADALELMGFLTNLVGSQHIQRFIPLAEPQSEADVGSTTATVQTPRPAEETRELPKPKITEIQPKIATRREGKANSKPSAKIGGNARLAPAPANLGERERMVIADAVRLLQWGRKWHEIAELIARMADRPSLTEIRRMLREHKAAIEQQRAGAAPGPA